MQTSNFQNVQVLGNLNVSGSSLLADTYTTTLDSSGLVSGTSLSITGPATVNSLSTTGSISSGNITSTGSVTAQSCTLTGSLSVSGTISNPSPDVSLTLTVGGSLVTTPFTVQAVGYQSMRMFNLILPIIEVTQANQNLGGGNIVISGLGQYAPKNDNVSIIVNMQSLLSNFVTKAILSSNGTITIYGGLNAIVFGKVLGSIKNPDKLSFTYTLV